MQKTWEVILKYLHFRRYSENYDHDFQGTAAG